MGLEEIAMWVARILVPLGAFVLGSEWQKKQKKAEVEAETEIKTE